MAIKKYLDYDGLTELVLKIKELVGDAGSIVYKGTVADVEHLPSLDSTQKVGFMYTVTAAGETTSDFTDGAGLAIAANSEVAVVEVDVSGTATKKWCLLGPVFDVEDKLTFGSTMPSNPSNGDTFLYMGTSTEDTYEAATDLTPLSNPSELGLYVYSSGAYTLSTDVVAAKAFNLYAWYNGTELLYTESETPSIGDAVYIKESDTSWKSGGTVTEYDETQGIKASGATFTSAYYGRFDNSDSSKSRTYYTLIPGRTQGVVYVYDSTESEWVAKTYNDEIIGITNAEIDDLFE